jgi:hypothetical protein
MGKLLISRVKTLSDLLGEKNMIRPLKSVSALMKRESLNQDLVSIDDEKIEERPLEPTPASHLVPGQVQKPS